MTVVIWWVGITAAALILPLVNLLSEIAGMGTLRQSAALDGLEVVVLVGISALAIVGVVAVIALAWPIARIGRAGASSESPHERRSRSGTLSWFLVAVGWVLLGSACVMISSLRLMNWAGAAWLPDWWKTGIWVWTEVFGITLGWIGLAILVFAVLSAKLTKRRQLGATSQRATYRRVGMGLPKWRFGLRHMMFALAPIALLMVLVRDFGMSLVAVIGLMVPPLAVVSLFLVLRDRRSLQREALLQVMAMASRDGQPLGPAVAAFAPSCQGRFALRVARLADRLEAGDPLPLALDRVPNVLSRGGAIVARVDWETGTLARMLDDAVAADSTDKATRAAAVGSIAYPLAIVAAIVALGVFSTAFLAPKFTAILKDFEATMPEPSRTVLHATEGYFSFANVTSPTPGVILVVMIGGVFLVASLAGVTIARRVLDKIPLRDRLTQRRHASVILRALAAVIEAAQTVPFVLARLADRYPRRWTRDRLRKAAARVDRGEPAFDALYAEGLIGQSDAALLASAERVGNLPWALRQTADSGERRLAYRLVALGQIVRTFSFAALGGLVLLFALTYFRPLIAIIDLLSRSL